MRRAALLALLVLGLAPGEALAEDAPASVQGLKVAVPRARGRAAWGRNAITKAVRRTLGKALGGLVSEKKLKRAQKKLRIRGAKRYTDANLAKAGREAGAQWVLDIKITKKKWLYTATARLINTETGAEQMNFRSQFYKPKAEGRDRGQRIASRTVQKLDTLSREGPLPSVAPPPSSPRPGADPVAVAPPPDATPEDVGPAPQPTRVDDGPQGGDPYARTPEDSGRAGAASSGGTSSDPAPTRTTTTRPEPAPSDDDTELLRFALTAGSGLLRTYDVSSDAVAGSRLSYQLNPTSLVHADAEVILPGVPVTAVVDFAFRPVGYTAGPEGSETEVSGSFLDVSFMAGYHLVLSGEGRNAMRLIPLVGARLGINSAGEDPSGALLGNSLVAVQAGLLARLPINEVLELNLGAEGGWIASYSESPTTSGNSAAGFTVAGELGARIWLSSMIAIAFNNRFTYEQVGFNGAPTRVVPSLEQASLQNITIATRDLRSSIGIAFRL